MWPAPDDACQTRTSVEQRCTEEAIYERMKPFVGENAQPLPPLYGDEHIAYLRRLLQPLPAPYVTFDSNRAWMLYWIAHSLDLLRAPLRGALQARAISTLLHFQSPHGGFGGGPAQMGHLMSTYAAVCALAILGGPGGAPTSDDVQLGVHEERGGWDAIDRAAMYDWMMRLKQPDGSFLVHEQGEIDVRATYCVVAISMLLGIATDELLHNTGAFVRSCQTYEGGFAAQSAPSYTLQEHGIVPAAPVPSQAAQGEAHGGYSYCALATHAFLSFVGRADAGVDIPMLVRWATSLQGSLPYEGGGMRGRTNKLVDGCYGWFCGGGLMTLLEMLTEDEATDATTSDSWSTVSDERSSFWDRSALRTYILAVAQIPRGGLCDKPGKRPDAYHTCYNLSGLSLCEHRVHRSAAAAVRAEEAYDRHMHRDALHRACYVQCMAWAADDDGAATYVEATHPLVNVSLLHVARIAAHMYAVRVRRGTD